MDKGDIHIEGSGRDVTTITGSGFQILQISGNTSLGRLSVTNPVGDGLAAYDGHVDLREVRVSSTRDTDASFASAVTIAFSAHGSLRDVIVEATNNRGNAQGLFVNSENSEVSVLRDVSVEARSGPGLFAEGIEIGSSASLDGVRIESTWAALMVIATGPNPPLVTITNSRIHGENNGLTAASNGVSTIIVQGSSVKGGSISVGLDSLSTADVKIAHTELDGLAYSDSPNTLTCFGAYDAALRPLDASCQPQAPVAGKARSGSARPNH